MKPICKICEKKIEGSISFSEGYDFQPCHFDCNIKIKHINNEDVNNLQEQKSGEERKNLHTLQIENND